MTPKSLRSETNLGWDANRAGLTLPPRIPYCWELQDEHFSKHSMNLGSPRPSAKEAVGVRGRMHSWSVSRGALRSSSRAACRRKLSQQRDVPLTPGLSPRWGKGSRCFRLRMFHCLSADVFLKVPQAVPPQSSNAGDSELQCARVSRLLV